MIKIKIVEGFSAEDLTRKLNEALREIESEPKITYYESKWAAVIEQAVEEAYKDRLCCDCIYWDDKGNNQSLNGFCTLTGKRMRFNCRACKQFKDLRD